VFLLCKTSNPGAQDVQDLLVRSEGESRQVLGANSALHVHVAKLAQSWNTQNNIGLVVGATHPESLARVRAAAPDLWFLVPGVGAQGGDLESALRAGLWTNGKGMLINVSRGISRAADPGRAATDLRDSILTIRESARSSKTTSGMVAARLPSAEASLSPLADALLSAGCIKFGEFTLKSGLKSPIYIDLRQIITHPKLLEQIGQAYLPILSNLRFERLAALPYAAIPIATAISLQGNYPMIYPRKEAKAYGTKAEIEGEYRRGETVVVIDDLATTGGSKFEAIDKLTSAGLTVKDVVVLVDRQSGARESLAQAGYTLHGVLAISDMLDHWEKTGKVDQDKIGATRKFLMQSHP
jgi:uridine monophosphate synthetase